jgi:hypothetical protein
MADRVDKAILDLLVAEREAILTGDFGALPPLALRKESLFGRLEAGQVNVPGLRRIGAQVSRNQRLLAAALRGLREVSDRLGLVRDLRQGFSTYDSQGQKSTVAAGKPTFEHKA